MARTGRDILWRQRLTECLQADLGREFPRLKVASTPVLKNIFMVHRDEGFRFELNFSDEDLVFFDTVLDLSEFINISKLNLGGVEKNRRMRIVVPQVVLRVYTDIVDPRILRQDAQTVGEIQALFPQSRHILCLLVGDGVGGEAARRQSPGFDHTVVMTGAAEPESAAAGWSSRDMTGYADLLRFVRIGLRSRGVKILSD